MNNQLLADVYYDPKNPAGFSSVDNLRHAVTNGFTKSKTREWASGQKTFTLHKRVVRNFKRRKTISKGLNHLWQGDLIQFDMIGRQNSNFNFILVCIDVFSRKAYAEPIKRKTGQSVANAMEIILANSDTTPKLLQVDSGAEFYNRHFQSILNKHGIEIYTVQSCKKASVIERFILTLKRRLFKWMTRNNTRKWLDVLPDLIHAYNHSIHGATGYRPVDITFKNEKEVWEHLYADEFPLKASFKFSTGQKVRIVNDKKMFTKSYFPQWSRTVYTIALRRATNPVTYKVKSPAGQVLKRPLYEQEIQAITEDEVPLNVEILKTRFNSQRQKEYRIHYVGWPSVYDRWLDSRKVRSVE